MEYKLSPSSLNLLEDCPRCFWLSQVKKIRRPAGPMSSIPIKMDSIIKNYFNKYREKGELPPIIQGKIVGRLAVDMPKTLTHEEENGIILYGRPDEYFEIQDKSIVAFDHKTKSKAPEEIHSSYQLQLNVYSYLLKMMGYKTTNKAYLAFYYPCDSELHHGMKIGCSVIEVKTNPERINSLINKAYGVLNGEIPEPIESCEYCNPPIIDIIADLISRGESKKLEFKSTLRMNLITKQIDKKIEHEVLKTITAFLNTDGGTLLIGVSDDYQVIGIENDAFPNDDKFLLHFQNLLKDKIGSIFCLFIEYDLFPSRGKKVLKVDCKKSDKQVFMKYDNEEEFYIRTGPSSEKLSGNKLIDYIKRRFG